METRRGRGKSAFTLIELLIVVVIIGVLIALLIPTFGAFRDRSLRNHCRNNLKSIYSILRQYAQQNDGMYPIVDHYYGANFSAQYYNPVSGLNVPYTVALRPIEQMKSAGASRRVFFCPFHRDYDRDYGRPRTWDVPTLSTNSSSGIKTVTVQFGYTFLINRGSVYGQTPFADGRAPTRTSTHPDNLPLVADDLHYRNNDSHRPESWFHGGGRYASQSSTEVEGFMNTDCNTLLGNGTVVWKDWAYLEDQGPAIYSGSGDMWWFYQGYDGLIE